MDIHFWWSYLKVWLKKYPTYLQFGHMSNIAQFLLRLSSMSDLYTFPAFIFDLIINGKSLKIFQRCADYEIHRVDICFSHINSSCISMATQGLGQTRNRKHCSKQGRGNPWEIWNSNFIGAKILWTHICWSSKCFFGPRVWRKSLYSIAIFQWTNKKMNTHLERSDRLELKILM